MASASNSSKGSKADKASKKRKATTDTPTAAVEGVQVDDDLDTENVDMVDTNEDDASEGRSASKKSKKVKRSEEATSAATGGERSDGEEGGGEEEVQVLSHAEQRKRRKLEKKRAKDPNYSKPESEEAREGAAASSRNEASGSQEGTADTKDPTATTPAERPAPRGRFGVWVGNLSFKTDADKLRKFFESCGTITRVHMPKGPKMAPNKGFAYVDFESEQEVDEAVKLSESGLDGRRLLIKNAKSYEGRPVAKATEAVINSLIGTDGSSPAGTAAAAAASTPEATAGASKAAAGAIGKGASEVTKSLSRTARKILDRQKNLPAPTLFLGNLGFDTTVEDIKEFFETHYQSNRNWLSKKERGLPKHRKKDKGAGKGKAKAKSAQGGENEGEDGDGDESDASSKAGDESSEDSEEEDDDADDDDQENDPRKKAAPAKADAGIRKVRLGTFEDTGKCKGWAFVDFHTTVQATAALIDPRNHSLNGRALVVEYASAEAVRRGGGRMDGLRSDNKHHDKTNSRNSAGEGRMGPREFKKRKFDETGSRADAAVEEDTQEVQPSTNQAFYRPPLALNPYKESGAASRAAAGTTSTSGKTHKPNKAEREALRAARGGKRQKPGAALANAARAKVAIQPAAGKKTVFEEE